MTSSVAFKVIFYAVIGVFFLVVATVTQASPIAKAGLSTQAIQLNNSAMIMLISDPTTKWGAVSLTLPVGQGNSPV